MLFNVTPERKKQFYAAIIIIAVTSIIWLTTQKTPDHNVQVFASAFFLCMSLWVVGLTILPFPVPAATSHLFHWTPAWDFIRNDRCIYPSADASIYLIDRNKKLGQVGHNDTKLVFLGAKANNLAAPARFFPFQYLRFKTARGEWITKPYHYLSIDRYIMRPKRSTVIVDSYRLLPVPPAAKWLLRLRLILSNIFLTTISFCCLGASLAHEIINSTSNRSALSSTTLWCGFVLFAVALLIAYFTQKRFNNYVFSLIRNHAVKNRPAQRRIGSFNVLRFGCNSHRKNNRRTLARKTGRTGRD